MNSQIEVTIVCITYNHVNYIRQALDSMIAQKTNFRYKILVHDDCSTDGTTDVLWQYANQYQDLIDLILEEENQISQGKSFYSKIQEKLEGKYVAICEGDDYWTDDRKLQFQYDFMESNMEYALITHGAEVLDDRKGEVTRLLCPSAVDVDFSTEDIIKSAGWLWATNSIFQRADLFELPDVYKHWGVGDFPRSIYLSTMGRVRYLAKTMSVYRSMARNSWTAENESDASIKIAGLEKRIKGLCDFNQYSEGRYAETVDFVVSKWKCEIAILKGDWSQVEDDSLQGYTSTLSLKTMFSMWVHCHFPRVYAVVKRCSALF